MIFSGFGNLAGGGEGGDPPGTRQSFKTDAAKTVSKIPKTPPNSGGRLITPGPQEHVRPYPDPLDVNNNDLGNPNTSLDLTIGIINGYPMGELATLAKIKSAFTAEELVNMAFHSGRGTADAATLAGYTTLGNTELGVKLAALTQGMLYEPGSPAFKAWAELSAEWANSVPKGSTVKVFLNNPNAEYIWSTVEKPILEARGVNINIIRVR